MENKNIINPELLLKKYEDSHEFHFHQLDRTWIVECMNEYKDACVEQKQKEWEKEKAEYEDILNSCKGKF